MNLKNKLCYIALGGLLMLIGMMASSVFMPNLVAQRDMFGQIECTSLTVVDGGTIGIYDNDGKLGVGLGIRERGGTVAVYDKNGKLGAGLGVRELGGTIGVYGNDGNPKVFHAADEHGGFVSVIGNDGSEVALDFDEVGSFVNVIGNDGKSGVALGVNERGGEVAVVGGKDGQEKVVLTVRHGDSGHITVLGKAGKVNLGVDKHGGAVGVFGYSDTKLDGDLDPDSLKAHLRDYLDHATVPKAALSIDGYGNGAISTWDKHGNRQ